MSGAEPFVAQPLGLVLLCLFAYLVGAIPCGYLAGRLRGIDIRSIGSGNIGASNATRALGTKLGLLVFAADVLKAALVPWMLRLLYPELSLTYVALVGFCAFIGHIYPVYLKFHGGKGVSCALGVCLVLSPAAGICSFLMYLQTLWLTRTSAVGSLTGVTTMALLALSGDNPTATPLTVVAMSAIIWVRHRSNLRDLMSEHRAKKQAKS